MQYLSGLNKPEAQHITILAQGLITTIDQWISWLNSLSIDKLLQIPPDKSWCIGQIYVHLIDDTAYFLDQVDTAILIESHAEMDMHEDARWIFDNGGFPDMQIEGPSKYTGISMPDSKEALMAGLLSLRSRVIQLQNINENADNFYTGKIKHPGLGYFNAAEWLRFADMHMKHHFRQKHRIEKMI